METLFYILIIGAAATVVVGLLVQIVGTFLFGALTLGVGVRDWWVDKWGPHQSKHHVFS
jgi:hypothetical protein